MKRSIPIHAKQLFFLLALLLSTSAFSQTVITVTECNYNGWRDHKFPNTTARFASGPAAPILGNGSLEYTTLTGGLANFRNEDYDKTLLSSLTAFHFSTYITERSKDTDNVLVVLQVDTDGDGLENDRLIFEPRWQTGIWVEGVLPDQGPILDNTWQTWDMLNAIWWLGPPRNLNPENNGIYFTLASYLEQYPDAQIVNQFFAGGIGGIRLNVGVPQMPPWFDYWGSKFVAYVDAFTISINGNTTIYDFEPSIANAGADQTVIYGYGSNCTTLHGTGAGGVAPYTYSWAAGGATWSGAEISVCPTETTTYTLTVTDDQGCSGTDEVTVFVNDVRCGVKMDKVMVCHNGEEICVSPAAVEAHLKHGDELGACTSNAIAQTSAGALHSEYSELNRIGLSNYPNPFVNVTTINYQLPFDGAVSLHVYDQAGRVVSTLVSGDKKAGMHAVSFGRNNLSAGIYYYKLTATSGAKVSAKTNKMILLE